jgi:hypothetical protein
VPDRDLDRPIGVDHEALLRAAAEESAFLTNVERARVAGLRRTAVASWAA